MIERLNNKQQVIVSGGSSYCEFADGKVLIHYNTGDTSLWALYNSWNEAIVCSKEKDGGRGIGSYTPKANSSTFKKMRRLMEEQQISEFEEIDSDF